MRVFFHLRHASETIRDEKGVEVSNLDEAKAEARNAIQELREKDAAARDWAGWKLEASDEKGSLLFSLRLDASH